MLCKILGPSQTTKADIDSVETIRCGVQDLSLRSRDDVVPSRAGIRIATWRAADGGLNHLPVMVESTYLHMTGIFFNASRTSKELWLLVYRNVLIDTRGRKCIGYESAMRGALRFTIIDGEAVA